MIFYKRILGFVLAFVFAIIIEIAYYNHKFFFYGFAISVILLLFYFWRIKNRFVERKEIMSYFKISFLFLLSLWCVFIVAYNFYIRNLIVLFSIYFFIILFESIFKKIYENTPINSNVLENTDLIIFLFLSFFTFFVFTFIRANLVLSFVFMFFCSIVCLHIKMYFAKIDPKIHKLSIFFIALIISEIYFVLALLPFNLSFLVFILWLCYYIMSDFIIEDLKGEFLMRKKSKILIISGGIVLLAFITILI